MAFWIPLAIAAFGTFSAVNTYQSQKREAEAVEKQARIKREAEMEQLRLDSLAESQKVLAERDEKRRLRDTMLAQYATSGILIDGSAEDILVKQREVDELNVQRIHDRGNAQRSLTNWKSETELAQSLYSAKSMKKGAKIGLATNLIGTGLSFGINTGMFGTNPFNSGNPSIFGGSNTMAGQTSHSNFQTNLSMS